MNFSLPKDRQELEDHEHQKERINDARKLNADSVNRIVTLAAGALTLSISIYSITGFSERVDLERLLNAWIFFIVVIVLGCFDLLWQSRLRYMWERYKMPLKNFYLVGNLSTREKLFLTFFAFSNIIFSNLQSRFYRRYLSSGNKGKEKQESALCYLLGVFSFLDSCLFFIELLVFVFFVAGFVAMVASIV